MKVLCLPEGHAVLAFLSMIPRLANAATQTYILDTTYSGSTFFNGWDFQTSPDLTHGFVQYISQSDAQSAGLITPGTPAYMGVDHKTTLDPSAQGRKSVRITTQKSWTHGLVIADLAHMPDSTCGVWPAFWMLGPNWPYNGEIDIVEGVSRNTKNKMSCHTGSNCIMTAGQSSGTINTLQCDGSQNGNVGCNIDSNTDGSYGTGFNNGGGGVYATEWTSDYIQTWFFPKGSVPSDISAGSPNPSGWGIPQSSFVGGSDCNIDAHFANQSLVFDTTFCGDWAGNVWGNDAVCTGLASSCVNYVAGNPSAFANTYWQVNSVKVYQKGVATSSSSTIRAASTTKSSSSTSSVKPSTSTSSSKVSSSFSSTKPTSSTTKPTSTSSTSKSSTSSSSSTSLSTSSSTKPSTTTLKSSTTTPTTKPSTTPAKSTSTSSIIKSSTTYSQPATKSSTTKSITTSMHPSSTPTGSWTSLGCYSDNISGRALPNGKTVTGSMTVEACQSACQASGYSLSGTEYGDECWCGNAVVNGGARVGNDGTSGCNARCKGDGAEWCGGSDRLSVWRFG